MNSLVKLRKRVLRAAEEVRKAQVRLAKLHFRLARAVEPHMREWRASRRAAIIAAVKADRHDLAKKFLDAYLYDDRLLVDEKFKAELNRLLEG